MRNNVEVSGAVGVRWNEWLGVTSPGKENYVLVYAKLENTELRQAELHSAATDV